MTECPNWKCHDKRLGIIRAELVHVGVILKHRCGAALYVESVEGPTMTVRLATAEEIAAASKPGGTP